MKIVVIGATGIIGKAIVAELNPRHEIISASYKNSDIQVDITSKQSIDAMYKKLNTIDAVVLATGKVHFAALKDMGEDDYKIGLTNKLMGQVNVVLAGLEYINDNGSFTLTSGILNRDPILYGSSAAMVNGALDGFIKSAALEMPRGIRINGVSPTVITEAMENYGPYFRGYEPVSAARAALAYSKSIEGAQTGQVYCVG
ncbi:TPA: short chain dehydrogenase [Legionella pneumophila]|uniref:Short chain dehydrogenase n=4 Tax=Legionella pneumophila TaxID=446 RepID=A0A131NBQ2_LEGPN|nr:short chain dehydrogenase [Legionella pneumophila]ERH42753.1 short-chain dehydrogenase [Legionella pneumophila str. Leg01/53]ERH46646.1 short-chain dehydrogenase [Legionella pneumophila str. Leg01/11]ERI48465.1 short-chain dehydrogenase [Legionella pneumophila str. Leg01/20]ABQ54315.1 short chain dehydrogenase [Legionella pneumophila str. Corby]ADG23550.1 short chain dehydrogenase [Legionella pneumophila 2300/99 Alcoy]